MCCMRYALQWNNLNCEIYDKHFFLPLIINNASRTVKFIYCVFFGFSHKAHRTVTNIYSNKNTHAEIERQILCLRKWHKLQKTECSEIQFILMKYWTVLI